MAFGDNSPEGDGIAQLQLMSETLMETGVMPGCAKSCALLQFCFVSRRQNNPDHQECLNQNRDWGSYF